LDPSANCIFEALGNASPHIRSGKLRPIALTSAKQSPFSHLFQWHRQLL